MKNKRTYFLLSGFIFVAIVAIIATIAVLPDSPSQNNNEFSSPDVPISQSAQDNPNDSITVHGHWTIEVRDSDGALVQYT